MTTKPRQPRPIGPAAAADAIAARIAEMEDNAISAAAKFRDEEKARVRAFVDRKVALVPADKRPQMFAVLETLCPDMPDGVVVDWIKPGPADTPAVELDEPEVTEATDPTPKGTLPIDPERAQRMERLAGRGR